MIGQTGMQGSMDDFRAKLALAERLLDTDPLAAASHAQACMDSDDSELSVTAAYIAGSASHQAGHLEEAVPLLAQAKSGFLALNQAAGDLMATLALGRVYRDLGKFEDASGHFTEAFGLAEAQGDLRSQSDALNLQASVLSAQGDYQNAISNLERALGIAVLLDDPVQQANLRNNMGELLRLQGNYPDALENLKSAHDLYQDATGAGRGATTNLVALGNLYQDMGLKADARAFFERARQAGRDDQDPLIEAVALNNIANSELDNGDWDAALVLFQEALDIAREAGASQYEIDNLDGLGQVYIALGDHDQAAEVHKKALGIATRIGDREGELDALVNLGRDYLVVDRLADALESLASALGLAEQMKYKSRVFQVHSLLSRAHERSGDPVKALFHARAYHETEKSVFNEEGEERTRQLAVKFEVERTRHQAEEYRLRTEIMQQARDEAEQMVRERTRELEEAQFEIVTRLAVAAEYRDDDTGTHTRRVGRNAAAIGYAMGFPEPDLEVLFTAARLHDVGKIGIPDSVLLKQERLDDKEMELMRTHTLIGARILSAGGSRLLHLAESISLFHHERWDGKGYPHGLAGDAIPVAVRIVAVSDVLDALCHARPYKPAWSVEDALIEIKRQSGTQFDPDAVAACLAVFGSPGSLSPVDDTADWSTLLDSLQTLGAERGFPALRRDSAW